MTEPDPLHNRRLIAERLGWPDGALDACLALEADFPRWSVYWTKGGLPPDPRRGYRAFARVHWARFDAVAETPEELRERLDEADAQLPDALA